MSYDVDFNQRFVLPYSKLKNIKQALFDELDNMLTEDFKCYAVYRHILNEMIDELEYKQFL